MRLLLDTNVLLWALLGSPRLSAALVRLIADPRNDVFVSAASAWEIAIKLSLGKLPVRPNVGEWLPAQVGAASMRMMAVTADHAVAVEHLPLHHRDPFDRLLVAQALTERLTLVTGDRQLAAYDVPLIVT